MGRKTIETNNMSSGDLDSLISPIYALTTVGMDMNSVGWMGYKAVPIDEEPKPRSTLFLVDLGLSPKTLDAILHILIICLVLFIIINCMCKFVWLFFKWTIQNPKVCILRLERYVGALLKMYLFYILLFYLIFLILYVYCLIISLIIIYIL